MESHAIGLRVLVIDDDADVRSALRVALIQQPDVTSVTLADTADDLIEQVAVSCADVVLLDWDRRARNAEESVRLVRLLRPDLAVIALSTRPETGQHALATGATRFVSKGEPPERLLEAVSGIHE